MTFSCFYYSKLVLVLILITPSFFVFSKNPPLTSFHLNYLHIFAEIIAKQNINEIVVIKTESIL